MTHSNCREKTLIRISRKLDESKKKILVEKDTIDKLDFDFMKKVTQATVAAAMEYLQ